MTSSGKIHDMVTDPGFKAESDQAGHLQVVVHHDIRRIDVAIKNAVDRIGNGLKSRNEAPVLIFTQTLQCGDLATGKVPNHDQ